MAVVVTGILAVVVVVAVFLAALLLALLTEKRRSERYMCRLERKLDAVKWEVLDEKARRKELDRVAAIEDQQRKAHGYGY